jgi:hypothetical protein
MSYEVKISVDMDFDPSLTCKIRRRTTGCPGIDNPSQDALANAAQAIGPYQNTQSRIHLTD